MTDNVPTTDLARAFALRIAHESPTLSDLAPAELERLARVVVAENLRDDLKRRAALEGIDYAGDRERYLALFASPHTRRTYTRALGRLDAWCARQGIAPAELSPASADDWLAFLSAEGSAPGKGLAPGTVRLAAACASAFWTWMERRHDTLRNPFRGTRARPKNRPTRPLAVPSDAEIRKLERAADPVLRAAIVLMSQGGLRVGALPSLNIAGERWTATTKGKEQIGPVPAEARPALKRAGLPLRAPFAELTAQAIADRFRYLVRKLHKAGKLRAAYSVHDLRHAFAVRFYQGSRHDLYATKQALGHASVAITERYLRSLGQETPT